VIQIDYSKSRSNATSIRNRAGYGVAPRLDKTSLLSRKLDTIEGLHSKEFSYRPTTHIFYLHVE